MEFSQHSDPAFDFREQSNVPDGRPEGNPSPAPGTIDDLLNGVDIRDDGYYYADTGEKLSEAHEAGLLNRVEQLRATANAATASPVKESQGINITIALSNDEAKDALLNVLLARKMADMQRFNMPAVPYGQPPHAPRLPSGMETTMSRQGAVNANDSSASSRNHPTRADEEKEAAVMPTASYREVDTSERQRPAQAPADSLLDSLPGQHTVVQRGKQKQSSKQPRSSKNKTRDLAPENTREKHPLLKAALGRSVLVFALGTAAYAPLSYIPLIGNDEHFLPAAIVNGQVAQGWDNVMNTVSSIPLVGNLVK